MRSRIVCSKFVIVSHGTKPLRLQAFKVCKIHLLSCLMTYVISPPGHPFCNEQSRDPSSEPSSEPSMIHPVTRLIEYQTTKKYAWIYYFSTLWRLWHLLWISIVGFRRLQRVSLLLRFVLHQLEKHMWNAGINVSSVPRYCDRFLLSHQGWRQSVGSACGYQCYWLLIKQQDKL